MEEFILPILTVLSAIISFIFAVVKHKPKLFFLGAIFILITGIIQPSREIIDTFIHNSPNKKIVADFPQDLDFFSHDIVRFNSGTSFFFDSENIKTDIKITRIYEKDKKFFIYILFNVTDKKNHVDWINQEAEVELFERNLVTGKTDKLDFYFYIAKTLLGHAEIYIGIKEVKRRFIFKNLIIKGKAFNFK